MLEVYKDKGDEAFRKGNNREAWTWYSKALEEWSRRNAAFRHSDDLRKLILSNRSAAYAAAGRYAEALADAKQLRSVWPTWPKSWFRSGRALEGAKAYIAALQQYATAWSLATDTKSQEELQCCMLRAAAHLTAPQMAAELLRMLRKTPAQVKEEQASRIAVCPDQTASIIVDSRSKYTVEQPDEDAVLMKYHETRCKEVIVHDSQSAVAAVSTTNVACPHMSVFLAAIQGVSSAELEEASYQVIKMLRQLGAAHGYPELTKRFVGWVVHGLPPPHEQACCQALVLMQLKLWGAAALCALNATVYARHQMFRDAYCTATRIDETAMITNKWTQQDYTACRSDFKTSLEDAMDQLAFCHHVLGASMLQHVLSLQDSVARAGDPDGNCQEGAASKPKVVYDCDNPGRTPRMLDWIHRSMGTDGAGIGAHEVPGVRPEHLRVVALMYGQAITNLSIAHELNPARADFKSALSSDDVQHFGGDMCWKAVRYGKRLVARLTVQYDQHVLRLEAQRQAADQVTNAHTHAVILPPPPPASGKACVQVSGPVDNGLQTLNSHPEIESQSVPACHNMVGCKELQRRDVDDDERAVTRLTTDVDIRTSSPYEASSLRHHDCGFQHDARKGSSCSVSLGLREVHIRVVLMFPDAQRRCASAQARSALLQAAHSATQRHLQELHSIIHSDNSTVVILDPGVLNVRCTLEGLKLGRCLGDAAQAQITIEISTNSQTVPPRSSSTDTACTELTTMSGMTKVASTMGCFAANVGLFYTAMKQYYNEHGVISSGGGLGIVEEKASGAAELVFSAPWFSPGNHSAQINPPQAIAGFADIDSAEEAAGCSIPPAVTSSNSHVTTVPSRNDTSSSSQHASALAAAEAIFPTDSLQEMLYLTTGLGTAQDGDFIRDSQVSAGVVPSRYPQNTQIARSFQVEDLHEANVTSKGVLAPTAHGSQVRRVPHESIPTSVSSSEGDTMRISPTVPEGQQQQQLNTSDDLPGDHQIIAGTTTSTAVTTSNRTNSRSNNTLCPLPHTDTCTRTPTLALPYEGYRLVNVRGDPLDRPRKHPFALSRVYYAGEEIPDEDNQVWFQPSDNSCRWRQTASEIIVLVTQVPLNSPARELSVKIDMNYLDIRNKVTGEVYLQGRLERPVRPDESTWWCPKSSSTETIILHSEQSPSTTTQSSCLEPATYTAGRCHASSASLSSHNSALAAVVTNSTSDQYEAVGCVIVLAKANLELLSASWRHAVTWWPRLLTHHAPVAWDDSHKDYSDLPQYLLLEHKIREATAALEEKQKEAGEAQNDEDSAA